MYLAIFRFYCTPNELAVLHPCNKYVCLYGSIPEWMFRMNTTARALFNVFVCLHHTQYFYIYICAYASMQVHEKDINKNRLKKVLLLEYGCHIFTAFNLFKVRRILYGKNLNLNFRVISYKILEFVNVNYIK